MHKETESFELLKELLLNQRLAVLATSMRPHPYTSLVAFACSEDFRKIVFVTSRATNKYRNLAAEPNVSLLIDNRTHSAEDYAIGAAVTVIGSARDLPEDAAEPVITRFLQKHPQLASFARSPSTAICEVDVKTFYLVTHFQDVVEMDVTQWSSTNR